MKPSVNFHIHHIAIQTADFPRALRFYTEILGLPIFKKPFAFKKRTLAWLDAGSLLIELYSVKEGAEPQPYDTHRVGADHLALEVESLDEFLAYLVSNGVEVIKPPFLPPTGDPLQPRVAFVEGADGEEIELREACGDTKR